MRSAMHSSLTALRAGTSLLTGKCKAFAADRGGNFAMIFGLTSFALVMTAGMALDYSRLSSAKAQLNHAVDAAVLSTTRQITSGLIDEEDGEERVRDFIFANMDEHDTGVPVSIDEVTIDQNAKTLEVVASLDVPMTLTKITGVDIRRVATSSKAQFSNTLIEVAMAIDITGSMGWAAPGGGTRIDALKTAATNGIDKMYQAPNANDRVRVGIVPYAESVNVSPIINDIDYTGTSNGCVFERSDAERFTDEFASPTHPVGGTPDLVTPQYNWGIPNCPLAPILPMTNNANALKGHINGMNVLGGTAGHIAIAWAYYMLSPNWNEAWPEGSDVTPYGSGTKKFAVIMTDGEFNQHFSTGGGKVQSELYARSTCSEMKAKGIVVYTIAFAAGHDSEALMSDCATPNTPDSKHFFKANSGSELNAAFEQIASDITGLRLLN